jgi:hypothetical protein
LLWQGDETFLTHVMLALGSPTNSRRYLTITTESQLEGLGEGKAVFILDASIISKRLLDNEESKTEDRSKASLTLVETQLTQVRTSLASLKQWFAAAAVVLVAVVAKTLS